MTDHSACEIANDECLGDIRQVDLRNGPADLCRFHERTLSELGEIAFEEWYSIELGGDS